MNGLLFVAMGGALGASCRHLLGGAMLRARGPDKPLGFIAFSLEAINMFERRDYGTLLAYVSGSVLLSCAALLIGLILARKVFSL